MAVPVLALREFQNIEDVYAATEHVDAVLEYGSAAVVVVLELGNERVTIDVEENTQSPRP